MGRRGKTKLKKGVSIGFCALVYLFLFLPISVIVVNSFNATTTKPYLSWKGFTFDWYVKLFDNTALLSAFGIAPTAGHQLAQLIATGHTDVDLTQLYYDRFKAKI